MHIDDWVNEVHDQLMERGLSSQDADNVILRANISPDFVEVFFNNESASAGASMALQIYEQ